MTRRLALILVSLLAVASVATPAVATLSSEQRRAVLDEAITAYDRGVELQRTRPDEATRFFLDAAARFELLAGDGVENGLLFYDLGNARLQAGELGAAILAYRRAEALVPGDARLARNLAYARSLRRMQIEPAGSRALTDALLGWHRRTTVRARAAVFAFAWVVFWLALTLRRGRRSGLLAWIAVLAAPVWLATAGSLAAERFGATAPPGVVLQNDVVVRKGYGVGFEPAFEQSLHEGVEFVLRDRRDGWLEIELPDGKTGWIPAASAGLAGQ